LIQAAFIWNLCSSRRETIRGWSCMSAACSPLLVDHGIFPRLHPSRCFSTFGGMVDGTVIEFWRTPPYPVLRRLSGFSSQVADNDTAQTSLSPASSHKLRSPTVLLFHVSFAAMRKSKGQVWLVAFKMLFYIHVTRNALPFSACPGGASTSS
jgi:hypothetical protein